MRHERPDNDDQSPEEVEEIMRALAARGIVRDSGHRRNGEIVWVKVRDLDVGEELLL